MMNKYYKQVMTIKKLFIFGAMIFAVLGLSGCDIIQEEIKRAESIEFEDFKLDIEQRAVYLKITSDAEEQVIEEMNVNGETYELESQGDDWYTMPDVPVEKSYEVSSVYYSTGIGMRLSFDYNKSITLDEALKEIPESMIHELNTTPVELGDYVFSFSDTDLASIETSVTHEKDHVADWLMVVTEEDTPKYVVFEHDGTFVLEVPEDAKDYLK